MKLPVFFWGLAACGLCTQTVVAAAPNVLFILVDDLGYMDIGANNPNTFYETPRVDALARQSMRFTNGYAANPVCSPTRYSIMTGKYPTRVGATNFFSGKRSGRFLPAKLNDRMALSEITLAEALKSQGYATAFFGKWHLGPTAEFWPEAQGFDLNFGGHNRGLPPGGYFAPYRNPKLTDGPQGEHLTQRLTDEVLKTLERFRKQPFLIYLSFYTVHTPLQAPKALVEKYRTKADKLGVEDVQFAIEEQVWPTGRPRRVRVQQRHATYAAMVESMDTQVGRVLDKLEELGLADNTVVCFTSDNGGLSTSEGSPTSNLPLRGGKGWLYEGGIREPFLIKWPGVVPAGSVCHTPVMSTDFFPTLLEITGGQPRADSKFDGISLVPLLKRTGIPQRPALFWHYPHYSNQGGFPGAAMRAGQYKLIERFEDGRLQLFDLESDLGERRDLAKTMPERVQSMRSQLHAWYRDVDAGFLRARPNGPQPWRPED